MLPAPHQPGMEVDLMPKMEIVSDYVQDCKDAWPTSGYRAIAFQFFAEGWTEGDGIANFFVQTATENKEEHYVDTAFSVSIRENAGEFTKIVVLNVDSMAEYVRVRVEFTPGFNSSAVVWASLNMLHRENLSTIGDCACDAGEATYDDAYAEGGTGVAHEEPDGEGGRDGDAPKGGADDPDDRSADEDSDGDRSDDDDSGDDPDVENYDGEEGVADDDSDGEGGGFRGEPGCACAIACDKTIERVLFKAATEAKRLEDKDDRLWGTGCRSSGTSIRNSGKNEDSEFHTVDLPPIYVAVVTHGQTAKIEGKISLKDQFPSSKNKASLAQTDSNFDEVEIKDLSQQLSNSFTVSGICGDTFYFKVYPSEIPNKPTNNHQFILTADFGDFICNTLLSAEGYRPNRNPTVARCACSIDPKRIEFNFSTYEALAAGIGLPGVFEPELVHLTLESAGQNHPRPYLITVEPVSNPVTGKDLFSVTPRKFNMYCDTTEPIAVKLTQAGLQLLAQEHIAATFNSGFGRFFGPLMAQEKRDVKIDQAFVVKIAGRECDRFTAHAEMFCDLDQMESEAKSAMMKAVSKPSVKTTYSVGSTGASWKDSASSAKAREASGEAVVAVPSVHSSIEVNTEVDIVFGSEWVAMDCCCVKLESILVSIDVHMQVPETWYSEIGAADFSSDEARSEMKAMFTDWGSNFPKRKKLKQQISSLVVDMLASNLDDLFARAGLPLPGRLPYCSKEPDLNECARMADSLTNAVNSPGMGMEPSEREKLEASVRDIVLGAIGSMKKHKSLDDIKKAKIKAAIEKQVAEQLEKMKQDYDDQMAYWGRNRGTHYFSGYGRYCGPGSLGGEPIDEIDNCCKIHDECYGLGGFDAAKVQAGTLSAAEKRFQLNCDIALCECADSHVKSRRDSQVAYNMCNWFKMDHDSDDWTAWSPNAWAHNESLLRNWPIIVPRLLIKEPD